MKFKFTPLRTTLLAIFYFCFGTFSVQAWAADKCKTPGADVNLARAQEFLAENAKLKGVITTASGMQYKIITPGSGNKKPKTNGEVVTHYILYNLNNKKIESSRDRGLPYQTKLNKVIKGWTEALQDMTEGERRMLYIPPSLAYGCKGARPVIGGNELLIFDMELMHIVQPGE